jgi:cardiolipin synthase
VPGQKPRRPDIACAQNGSRGITGLACYIQRCMTFLDQLRAAPNLLTLLRLIAVPFLVIAILDRHEEVALLIFVVAGATDAVDGRLARRLNQSTRLGQYLDPIADKLMLSTLFLTTTYIGLVPRYVTILVFARDLGILLIATLLFFTHTMRDFKPSAIGKLNTLVQIFTMLVVMVTSVKTTHELNVLRHWLLVGIAWLAPLSAAQYAWVVTRRIATEPLESL